MPNLREPIGDSFRVLGLYIRGQVLVGLALAALYSLAFLLLKIPYWYLIGLAGGIACVIPRIGALVPLGLAVLALDISDAPWQRYLWVLGVWFLILLLEFAVLMPRFVSKPLGLKELPVLAALLAGSLFFGPVGLLLAIPALAVGMVFWRFWRRKRHG